MPEWLRQLLCQHKWTEPREVGCRVTDYRLNLAEIETVQECVKCGRRRWWVRDF